MHRIIIKAYNNKVISKIRAVDNLNMAMSSHNVLLNKIGPKNNITKKMIINIHLK